ncbi:hypothetical protein DFH07DRAFT_839184 [Mycena maculata]|uniref:Uncharacterized protein n=1 Tax=Mycena maculata TaxID=230809 RepID=A0AAD7IEY3_9AGAR|nr:hypothetical protein DFH07DRAFT_839184 [Mycena maculata]
MSPRPCICQDPNARLTKDTLMNLAEFFKNLDPVSSTDDDLTFLLQYLKSDDIPSTDEVCCAHTLGQYHAMFALHSLASILKGGHPDDPVPVQRIVQSWQDIKKWIQYSYTDWILRRKFIGQQKQDRVQGFNSIIPFLTAATQIPELRDLMFSHPGEDRLLEILAFCWSIEGEAWFMETDNRFIEPQTAARPLSTLFENEGLKQLKGTSVEVHGVLCGIAGWNPTDIARNALTLLVKPSIALSHRHTHLQMLILLDIIPKFSDALLAQHSIRHVTRTLSDLASRAYNSDSSEEVAKCIVSCITYLARSITKSITKGDESIVQWSNCHGPFDR